MPKYRHNEDIMAGELIRVEYTADHTQVLAVTYDLSADDAEKIDPRRVMITGPLPADEAPKIGDIVYETEWDIDWMPADEFKKYFTLVDDV